jgi:surface polysaccharide O-acyltransferase-like enzyme
MRESHESAVLRLGVASGSAVAVLCAIYVAVLAVGLLTLPSPDHQVQQPWFTLLELLILAIAPAIVVLSVALHAWSLPEHKSLALASVVFLGMCAAVTSAVHFAILTLSHQPAFVGEPWSPLIFSFQWPSVVYALDILAWDIFFPLGALFAAASMQGSGLTRLARVVMVVSAVLAFVGALGVPLANMQLRNVGIIGYAVLFPIAAALLAVLFQRTRRGRAA